MIAELPLRHYRQFMTFRAHTIPVMLALKFDGGGNGQKGAISRVPLHSLRATKSLSATQPCDTTSGSIQS